MRCRAVLLKIDGLSSTKAGKQIGYEPSLRERMGKRFLSEGITSLQIHPGCGRKPIMNCLDQEAVRAAIEQDSHTGQC